MEDMVNTFFPFILKNQNVNQCDDCVFYMNDIFLLIMLILFILYKLLD